MSPVNLPSFEQRHEHKLLIGSQVEMLLVILTLRIHAVRYVQPPITNNTSPLQSASPRPPGGRPSY